MTEEELSNLLRDQLETLDDEICVTETVRPFVEQYLVGDDEIEDSYVSHVYSLIEKSESMVLLVDEFLESKHMDRKLVEKANDLVSRAKEEIARFREQKDFASLEISDETDKLQ